MIVKNGYGKDHITSDETDMIFIQDTMWAKVLQ